MIQRNTHNTPTLSVSVGFRQSGAVLIVVLLVLILIMIAGAIAVRQSNTDLRLATADQVDKVMFQANDAAFMKVEKEDRTLSARARSADTLKEYMTHPQREGHQITLCVRPRATRLFNILQVSERNKDGDLLAGRTGGFCNPASSDDYVSEGRVISQMTFVRPINNIDAGVFDQEVAGTFSNDFEKPTGGVGSPIQCVEFTGYVTSVIPALSDAPLGDASTPVTDTSTIAGCLKQPVTGTNNIDTCLTNLGVPFHTHEQVYLNQQVGIRCLSGK